MMDDQPTLLLHGNFHRPCGFKVINLRLAAGLEQAGFRVFRAPNDGLAVVPLDGRPSIYLFHGDPYEFDHAPADLNAIFLHWEYLQLPPDWVSRINARFDLVIAPSDFSRDVYRRSGITLPIIVFPAAVAHEEFSPSAAPWNAPTEKQFRFVHLGGAHERRGTDILLQAYAEEFSAGDDVALILKAFQYEHYRGWIAERLRPFVEDDAPEIIYIHETLPSAAGVFTAADAGVYPLRAECFGLPVLECIASGRPVIVPRGTGLDQFCSPANARFVQAEVIEAAEKSGLEPDVAHLRQLMRAVYEEGKLDEAARQQIAATAADFTWSRSIAALASGLKTYGRDRGRKRLASSLQPYLLLTNGLPEQRALQLENAEREICSVPPRRFNSFESWAVGLALKEAPDVNGRAPIGATYTQENGCQGLTDFLFYAHSPFLDGVRLLFEAWHEADPPGAVLRCLTDKVVLTSPYLLRFLVQHGNIILHDSQKEDFTSLLAQSQCLIYPTFGDNVGDIVAAAHDNGLCTIVSPHSVASGDVRRGFVLEELTVPALATAITQAAQDSGAAHD